MVESIRESDGKTSREVRYYISSLAPDAQRIATAVRNRNHWSIENPLHWLLDVAFGEDECRIRSGHAPENFILLRHLARSHPQQGNHCQHRGEKQASAGSMG